MTAAESCWKLVDDLPASLVALLIQQLREGRQPRLPNPGYQARVESFLQMWPQSKSELAPMLELALVARRAMPTNDLVWTGPSTASIPSRRTEQVISEMIDSAAQTLTVLSFGIYQIPRLVQRLEDALARGLAIRFVLGERELWSEESIQRQKQQLGAVLASRALLLHWPPDKRPRDHNGSAGLMHAKAAIADSRVAFLSSANLTAAALERNIELGVLIRGGALPAAIDRLVDALIEAGDLQIV